MGIAIVDAAVLKDVKIDPRTVKEAKITYVQAGEQFDVEAAYHKNPDTGDIRLATKDEIPPNSPLLVTLKGQDGVPSSGYTGFFNEKGVFVPEVQ